MSGCRELVATSKPTRENSLFHRCTYRKCKHKELVAIACDRCHHNYCIRLVVGFVNGKIPHSGKIWQICSYKSFDKEKFDKLDRSSQKLIII